MFLGNVEGLEGKNRPEGVGKGKESAVQCPKNKNVSLVDRVLGSNLAAQFCPDCQGTWIPAEEYKMWQESQPSVPVQLDALPQMLAVDFVRSPLDTKAALCPECRHYLARARVSLRTPFYVERCPNCNGIWCDRGEWDILEKLGLHRAIEQLFSSEWQARVRERGHHDQERQAMIEKLGPDIAAQVFALADVLRQHPHGDFGVAYLMRRFDR